MGVNLIHASLMHAGNPTAIISALLDDLTRARIEVRPPAMRAAAPCGRGCSRLARQAVRLNLRPHAAMCWHCQGPCTSLGHASPARRMPREQARSCAAAAGHGGAWVPRPWGLCRQRPQNTLTHGSAAQRRAGGPHRLRGPALLRLRQPRGRAAPGAEGPVRRRAVRPVRCARGGALRPPVATGGLLRPSITQPSGSLAWMYCLQSLHSACCCIRPAAFPELCTPGRMACCPGRMAAGLCTTRAHCRAWCRARAPDARHAAGRQGACRSRRRRCTRRTCCWCAGASGRSRCCTTTCYSVRRPPGRRAGQKDASQLLCSPATVGVACAPAPLHPGAILLLSGRCRRRRH